MARKNRDEEVNLSMTPLIDVVLLLLIFYVVTSSFVDREIQLELPESEASAIPDEKKKFTVEIGQGGAIALNGKATTIELLDRTIEVAAAADDIQSVEIRADRNVTHGRVVQVLGIIKKHGVDTIGIAVKPAQG
ncbi:MAG: biopolymer transporter ExbD [Myxococcota bacterium]